MAASERATLPYDQGWQEQWEVPQTVRFILDQNYTRVTLQLPDHLLSLAAPLAVCLQEALLAHNVKVFVLADTSYNNESVDQVAAQHVTSDCTVHYGHASLAPAAALPAYYVFGREPIDLQQTSTAILEYCRTSGNLEGCKALVVILDQPLLHAAGQLHSMLQAGGAQEQLPVTFAEARTRFIDPAVTDASSQGHSPYTWQLPEGAEPQSCVWLWVGPEDSPLLQQLQMTLHGAQWAMYSPSEQRWQEGLPLGITRMVKRRYYLMEQAKLANIVGILMGTTAAAGLRETADLIRSLAKQAGKKTYTLLVGKPVPAKLANFPEIEVFVLIADAQAQILDTKEFLAPIIMPHEAVLAFSPDAGYSAHWPEHFSEVLKLAGTSSDAANAPGSELAVRPDLFLATQSGSKNLVDIRSAAEYLHGRRQYRGLEIPLLGAEDKAAEPAVAGRSGRAAGYTDEL